MKQYKISTLLSIFLLLICLQHTAIAQTNTEKTTIKKNVKSVLLVPFDPKLYLSEADMQIGKASKKTFHEIRDYFRNNLMAYLLMDMTRFYDAKTLLSSSSTMSTESYDEDLQMIYSILNYKYEKPIKPDIDGAENSKTAKKDTTENGIMNGQIVADNNRSHTGEYINIVTSDSNIFPYLCNKYHVDYVLFINQLDIRLILPENENYTPLKLNKEIKIHYSVFDREGKQIAGNYASTIVPAEENDIQSITKTYFPKITLQIQTDISQLSN